MTETSRAGSGIGSGQTSSWGKGAFQHSESTRLSIADTLQLIRRENGNVYAIFPCVREDAHLTLGRAFCAAQKMVSDKASEGHVDWIIIVGNPTQVKVPERALASKGVPYSDMKIIDSSTTLMTSINLGLSEIKESIKSGKKITGIKFFAPDSKGEEIIQDWRFEKRKPENRELVGVPVQLVRVKDEVSDSKRLVDTVSLHLNPGRHGVASLMSYLGKFMAGFFNKL